MKIIDLLNKISNGEEVPKKIKFNNSIYEYHDKEHGYCRYYHDNTYICLETDYYWFDILNDEVEIIEEEKEIPEKLETYKEVDEEDYFANILKVSVNGECEIDEATSVIVDKINDIIDYLQYLKSKGE